MAGERLTAQPLGTFTEPLDAAARRPGTYIRCTQDPLVPSFQGFAARFEGRGRGIGQGHEAMITSRPPSQG